MNFQGLGITFGAQDKGLAGAIKQTTSGLTEISKSVLDIGLNSAKWALKPPNFGPAIALTQNLAGDVKMTTTSMEAFGVAASKVTSAGLAGLKLSSKEFAAAKSQIAGAAFSMNTDVGSVTKTFVGLKQAGVDITKYGFSGLEEYQKFIEVTGADAGRFSSAISKMNKQMGMSEKEIKGTIAAVAAIGKEFNIGREAVAGMSDVVDMLNENSNLLPQDWSPSRMTEFLKGTTVVAGALTSIGFTADESMAASKGMTKSLLDNGKGLKGLYAGLTNTLPGGFQVLTENLGDANSAFKILQSDPKKFMATMGKLMDKVNGMNLNPEALNRFRLQMTGVLGPEAMAVFTKKGYGQLGPALEKGEQAIKDNANAVHEMTSRYEDGRTMAERFAIAQDQMHTALKQQVKGVMDDGTYLKKYQEQTKGLVKTLSGFAEKGGVLGKATAMLIEFANHGVGGALAAQTSWGLALSEGIKLLQPMIQYIPMLTAAFSALTSPIGLVVGGLAALYFAGKDLAKGNGSVLRGWIDKIKKDGPELLSQIEDIASDVASTVGSVLSQIDWGGVWDTFVKVASKVGGWLADGIAAAIPYVVKAVQKIPDLLVSVIDGLDNALSQKFPQSAEAIHLWMTRIKAVGYAIKETVVWVAEAIGTVVSKVISIGETIGSAASFLYNAAFGAIKQVEQGAMDMQKEMESTSRTISDATVKATADSAKQILDIAHQHGIVTDGYVKTIKGQIISASDAVVQYNKDAAGQVVSIVRSASDMVKAQITDTVSVEYQKMTDDLAAAGRKLIVRSEEDMADWDADVAKQHDEFFKKNGVRWDVYNNQQKMISAQYAITKEQLAQLQASGTGYADVMISLQSSLANADNERLLALDKMLSKDPQNIANLNQYIEGYIKLANAQYANRKLLEDASEIAGGKISNLMKQYTGDLQATQAFAERAGAAISQAFRSNFDVQIQKIPEAAKQVRSQLAMDLNTLQKAEASAVQQIINNNKLVGQAKDDAISDVKKKYEGQAQALFNSLNGLSKNLASGNEDLALAALKGIEEPMKATVGKVSKVAAEASGEVTRSFGVSSDTAASMVTTINDLNPKRFVANMGVVQVSLNTFLTTMQAQSMRLIKDTTDSTNRFFDSSKKGWDDQVKLIQEFSAKAVLHVNTFWTTVVARAGLAVTDFVSMTAKIDDRLASLGRSFNIMDLLASPDQITRWASSVVSALSYAFRTGGAADAMINASYAKALAMSAQVSLQASPATPAPNTPSTNASTDTATATQSLMDVINTPLWTTKNSPIPLTLDEMRKSLADISKALNAKPSTSRETPSPPDIR